MLTPNTLDLGRMSDAGDDINVEPTDQQEVVAEVPKGKMSVEEALQVRRSLLCGVADNQLVLLLHSKS